MLKKENIKRKVYNFTAIFEPAEEGGYVVYIPALPGCATQGDTFEEAEVMAKDAIEGYLRSSDFSQQNDKKDCANSKAQQRHKTRSFV